MARRLIASFTNPENRKTAKVWYDKEWNEHIVAYWDNGVRSEDSYLDEYPKESINTAMVLIGLEPKYSRKEIIAELNRR